MVQKYQKPVHLAFNSLYYRPEQYEEIAQIIQQCRSIGFDSYILADPALLVYLRKEKIDCEVHLSGDLGTVNSAMTEVFAKEYPKRIIFQRKNTISEMRAVIRHITAQKEAARKEWTYPTEFEAFALNELCQFSGAFCNSLHCDEMGYLCRVPYWKKPMSLSESKLEKQEKNRPGENISISEWDSASELTNPVSEDGYLRGARLFYPPNFLLLDYILKQAAHLGIERKKEIIIQKTRQELYEECGITVKTLGRTISKLKEDGVISLKKGKIAMTLEQYHLAQNTIHHYVNY